MRPGIKIEHEIESTGKEAIGDVIAVVHVRMSLNRGEEVFTSKPEMPLWVRLKNREHHIVGLRYGIEGMRVGGKRNMVISPHLAYGEKGVPGKIPPNAIVRCEVELCDVLGPDARDARYNPAGKQIIIFRQGEAARNLPRWQFGLREDGTCGVSITHSLPDLSWRHAVPKTVEAQLDPAITQSLFDAALVLPEKFPDDCLKNDECWADMTEKQNNITRDQKSNMLCWFFGVSENGQLLSHLLKENSRAILESPIFRLVADLAEGRPTQPPNS